MTEKNSKQMSKDLQNLAGKAIRPDQRLKAEDLVASELATAILSEPLAKIRHTIEALMLLDEDERSSAGITEKEVSRAERIYTLANAIKFTFVDKFRTKFGDVIERSATIRWGFDSDEVHDYEEWLDRVGIRWYKLSEREEARKHEIMEKEEDRLVEFYKLTNGYKITIESFNEIKIRFIKNAMPEVAKLMKKIIQLVSSSSFQAAMKRLKGGASGSQGQD